MAKKIKPPRDKEAEKLAEQEAKNKSAEVLAEEEAAAAEAEAAAIQDEFQARGFELVEWVHENKAIVVGFLGAVVLAGLGYGVYTVVDRGNNTEASAAWVRALDIWEAPVGDDPDPSDDKPAYETADKKYQAARTAFEGVVAKHGTRGGSLLSSLYIGHASLKLGDNAGAIKAYETFLAGVSATDPLRFAGYNGLATAKEAAGDIKGAIKALEDLVALADKADEDAALLGLGRLYQKDGNVDLARKRLETLLVDFPETPLKGRADDLLAQLGQDAPKAEKPTP